MFLLYFTCFAKSIEYSKFVQIFPVTYAPGMFFIVRLMRLRFSSTSRTETLTTSPTLTTLEDIVKELQKPGRDPRDELPPPVLRTDVLEMKDLKPGMVLTGTVRNVIDFGVFVDIGVHQDGLVHISEVCNRRLRHPSEAVKVGDN